MSKLILICGTSFAGKSTLARQIAARFGFAEVDVDITKVDLFGADVVDESLERGDWDQMYAETDRRLADHLDAGRTVIDASRNFSRAERDHAREIGRMHGAEVVTVFVDTPEEITRQRLLANRQSHERRDVSDEDFADILAAWVPPGEDEYLIIFRDGDDISAWLERHAGGLTGMFDLR